MKTNRIAEIKDYMLTEFCSKTIERLAYVATKAGAERYPEIILFTSPFEAKVLQRDRVLTISAMGVRESSTAVDRVDAVALAILALTIYRSPVAWKSSLREDSILTEIKFMCARMFDNESILSKSWDQVFFESAEHVVAKSYRSTNGDTPTVFFAPSTDLLVRYPKALDGFDCIKKLVRAYARRERGEISFWDFIALRDTLLSGDVFTSYPSLVEAYDAAASAIGGKR